MRLLVPGLRSPRGASGLCYLCLFVLLGTFVHVYFLFFLCSQELHDLQAASEQHRTASSERAAAAFARARDRASLRAAIWQWRVIAVKVCTKYI